MAHALSALLSAKSMQPYGSLVIFTYLFGSLSLAGTIALWYRARNNHRDEELRPEDKRDQERVIFFRPVDPEKKTKDYTERRKFARLEVDNLTFKQRPRFRVETMDNARPTYDCRLRNLGLGGVQFELGPKAHVPLIAQMEISLPGSQPVEVCAKIVWYRSVQTKRKSYGACFLTIDKTARKILDLYLAQNLHSHKADINFGQSASQNNALKEDF